MLKRVFLLLIISMSLTSINVNKLIAQDNNSTSNSASGPNSSSNIDKNNQMMLTFVERLKTGNVNEARKIANEMISASKKYKDDATTEYKSFYSDIEKEYYLQLNKNSKKKVVWVDEPIADGYYFLAVMDFQDKHYQDAIDNIQKCIFWNPVRAPYYCERGFIFLNSGIYSDIVSAQVAYEQALEYADNEDDFASALRGLGFVFSSRNEFVEAMAAFVLSQKYDPESLDTKEQIIYIKKLVPSFNFNMDVKEAQKILKESKIQTTFSPEHSKILIKLASELKMPEQKDKALVFLTRAMMLDPNNQTIENKIKEIKKIK